MYVESGCWYSNEEANAGEILLEMAGSWHGWREVGAVKETPTVVYSNYLFGTRSPQTSVGWLGLHALCLRCSSLCRRAISNTRQLHNVRPTLFTERICACGLEPATSAATIGSPNSCACPSYQVGFLESACDHIPVY
jgi:hypothetical protein